MEEKIKIFFCEDDENLGRQKGILPTYSLTERQVTKVSRRPNTTCVYWM